METNSNAETTSMNNGRKLALDQSFPFLTLVLQPRISRSQLSAPLVCPASLACASVFPREFFLWFFTLYKTTRSLRDRVPQGRSS